MTEKDKTFLRAKDLADMLGMSINTMYQYRHRGMPVECETPLRFNYYAVKEWLKSRKRKRGQS